MKRYRRTFSVAISACLALGMCTTAFAAKDDMNNFKKSATYTNQFADVSANHWSAASVKLCYEYGLMNGSDKGFLPSNNLTIAEALVMADRVHQIYTDGESTLQNGTPWYQTYVTYAIDNGIIKAGDFSNYTKKATRSEMAYIFAHALPYTELTAINTVTTLPDVSVATQYSAEIFELYNAGVLTGSDEFGTYKPNSTITRAEAAAIISRVAIPSQRKTVLLKEYSNVKEGLYTVPGTTHTLYVTKTGNTVHFTAYWFRDDIIKSTLVEESADLNGKSAHFVCADEPTPDPSSGIISFDGSFATITFDKDDGIYTPQTTRFIWLRDSMWELSDAQLRSVARSLGVPDNLSITFHQDEASYWDAGNRYTTFVQVLCNGKAVAYASVDSFTAELVRTIYMYNP